MEDPALTGQQPPMAPVPAVPFLQRIGPIPFALIALASVLFLYQIVGGVITFLLFGMNLSLENIQFVRIATIVGQVLFMLVPTLWFVRARGEEIGRFLRLNVPDYKQIILTVIAMFALQQMLQGYMAVQNAIPLPDVLERAIERVKELFEQTYQLLMTTRSPGEFLFVVVVVALTPAVCEEILFRGLVQRSIEKVTPGLTGAIIAGAIFAGFHLIPYNLVPLTVLGVYFGFVVYRSNSLLVSISTHFFNNFIAVTASYLQLNDDFVAIAPHRTPTPSLMLLNTAFFALVFIASTYYFVQVTRTEKEG
jgi:membrane protease YdiL (CAAX protease family)